MRKRALVSQMILVIILLFSFGLMNVGAAERDGLLFKIDCDGFTSRGGAIELTRDNTGVGRETFVVVATDGNGNTVFNPISESFLVGSRLTFPIGASFAWTGQATANPIFLRVYSPAGNGYEEQEIYSVVGACAGLDTVVEQINLPEIIDGTTSPSIMINQDPPRPGSSSPALLNAVPGYVIVTAGQLNIRSGDDIAYTIVGRVPLGAQVAVLGRNENRSWWYVKTGDIVGWLNATEVIIRGDLSDVPVVPVTGTLDRPRFITFSRTHLAVVPVQGSLSVCDIAGNVEYYIVGRTEVSDWFEIEAVCDGVPVTGWVSTEVGAVRNPGEHLIPVTD